MASIPVLTASIERQLNSSNFSESPKRQIQKVNESGMVTWWFPDGADSYILPLAAGVEVDPSDPNHRQWLEKTPSIPLIGLPVVGATYGNDTLVMIAPWPHYGKVIIEDKLGIQFDLPEDRLHASPTDVITVKASSDPLAVAHAFRYWRETSEDLGAVPAVRTLKQKLDDLPMVEELLGAPHIYLWGPALFSQYDLPRNKWIPFGKALKAAEKSSFAGRLTSTFSDDQNQALNELTGSDWPAAYLIRSIAQAIDTRLTDPTLLDLPVGTHPTSVASKNRAALKAQFQNLLRPIENWGDGFSIPMLENLQEAGIDRANLVINDLYAKSARPEVTQYANELGYLIGPYDSYHSIHSPNAAPDETWETAQFDLEAFEKSHVKNADGSGHAGFKSIGYHFSPKAAWPYVQKRVGGILSHTDYSTWFIDCDATGECFDDYNENHPTTRLEDSQLRRHRLHWLEKQKGVVVGSEAGSVIFSDVIHYGHGVNTPYIGHLSPKFRDRESPHFWGRHWPPDEPEMYFQPIKLPAALKSPYFDPLVRIPLYQAALGDQLITTHHWNFDSLKLSDVEHIRELIEILYMIPPMYHLNRNSWEDRKEKILKHYQFWSPLHRKLAPAPLTQFKYLSNDRQVQQTTFATGEGDVSLTVNFSDDTLAGYPPRSATVGGSIDVDQRVYEPGQ